MTPEQVQAELRELRESIRWRPATELPPDGEAVLAVFYGSFVIAFYHEGLWLGEDDEILTVTHWMPIPEAPR